MPSIILETNTTAIHDAKPRALWRDGPDTRGTFDIITLCLSTIFISVWSAYHPHLPGKLAHERSRIKDAIYMLHLFLGALLIPEGLPIRALLDLVETRKLW